MAATPFVVQRHHINNETLNHSQLRPGLLKCSFRFWQTL